MEDKIYQNELELNRLKLQGELLQAYEQPVYQRIINGRCGLNLLDIGCNNGQKTVKRFRGASFSHVIGVDYLEDLAQQAQQQYGNEVFSFHTCNVTAPDFIQQLRKIMKDKGIEAFDVIHMSFFLMHLKDPGVVLASLRSVLAPQGRLVMIEPDDSDSWIQPDPEGQYPEFIEMQLKDPYAGNRFSAKRLPMLLSENGYDEIRLEHSGIYVDRGEREKKQTVFSVFCSYFPEDIRILCSYEPENQTYRLCEEWVRTKYEKLHQTMLREDVKIHMGVKIYTCGLSSL